MFNRVGAGFGEKEDSSCVLSNHFVCIPSCRLLNIPSAHVYWKRVKIYFEEGCFLDQCQWCDAERTPAMQRTDWVSHLHGYLSRFGQLNKPLFIYQIFQTYIHFYVIVFAYIAHFYKYCNMDEISRILALYLKILKVYTLYWVIKSVKP